MSTSQTTARNASILGALQATEMLDARATLPAEILVAILDYLPVSDLMRVARTSWKMNEMVYDDTRWVSRLRSMGVWDEAEAKRRFEEARLRRREAAAAAKGQPGGANTSSGAGKQQQASTTLFDATAQPSPKSPSVPARVVDGFETLSLSQTKSSTTQDSAEILDVIKNARSIRGYARQEYGKIYGALAPFYYDLVQAKSHADPIVFKVFRDPERQARMLSNLQVFTKSDWSQGWNRREEKLSSMMGLFESAVLREFEQGYEHGDIDGRMKRYATVLHHLNGGVAGVNLYIDKHAIFNDAIIAGANSTVCLNPGVRDGIYLDPSRMFLETLLQKVNEQAPIMGRIFPQPDHVFWIFVDKIREDTLMEYCSTLFEAAHDRSLPAYLKAVSGVFEQCLWFFRSLAPPTAGSKGATEDRAREFAMKIFEPHLDTYLRDELDYFTKHAETEVGDWEKKLSEQDASAESFYMASFNRQADKKDFLSSFKKVVMMPVNALPTIPIGSPFATTKTNSSIENGSASISPAPSRPHTPGVGMTLDGRKSPMPPDKAPTDELAAKAALMATRLEGIKSLFSIEVALNLVHAAKTSLGRASAFIILGGQVGEEAREQCASVFVVLLRILGTRHVQVGFDKAIDHLSHYNPRDVADHSQRGVAPLVTFIELVNVGDLISQMIDVFYEQQLAASKIADKNDFLDPAARAKTKFEKLLDENVAAGLNRGIDVLMDEVEYLHGTMQLPTDYNPAPPAAPAGNDKNRRFTSGAVDFDIGPTATAQRVVDLVSAHTRMLTGTTEKSMLDVFNGEVGLRLFTAVCKHLKRQRVSTDGAVKLIADMNLYSDYVRTLRNADLLAYFAALRELSQIYLIDAAGHAKEMAAVIADGEKFGGVFRAEEVYEFAQRRADWYSVRRDVERAMYGMECSVM